MPARGRGPFTRYHGVGAAGPGPRTVRVNGKVLDPGPSLRLRHHSSDGFQWGYQQGSGPTQLALALLLDYTGSRDTALALYMRFRDLVVARLKADEDWWLTGAEMEQAIGAAAATATANAEGDEP